MADKRAFLFPMASFTMVWMTIDSRRGTEDGVRGLADGRAGRLPRGRGVGRFSSYAVFDEVEGVIGGEGGVEDRRWLYVI